jgi:hypothetical protein
MGMVQTLTYHVQRGEYVQRLVVVKDRRTHHVAPCTEAVGTLVNSAGDEFELPVEITSEGSVLITMDEAYTTDMTDDLYYFKVVANPYLYVYSMYGWIVNPPTAGRTRTVAEGTIEVTTSDFSNFFDDGTETELPSSGIIDGGAP